MPPLPAGRAATSLRCGLRALAAAALAAFLSYLIFCQSDSYKAFLDERKSSWVILYDYGAALGIVNLDARGSTVMLFLWLTLLASALLTLAYRNIPTPHCPHTKPRLARLRAKVRAGVGPGGCWRACAALGQRRQRRLSTVGADALVHATIALDPSSIPSV